MLINSTTYRFGKIFEKYNILLTIKSAGNVNSLPIEEIQFLMKNLPTQKALGPDTFIGESYKTLKKQITPFRHKLFRKSSTKEHFPIHKVNVHCFKSRMI